MVVRAQLHVPYGVAFITDPSLPEITPEDTGAGPVTQGSNCLAFWTLHESEGKAELVVLDAEHVASLPQIYDGLFSCPSLTLSVGHAERDIFLITVTETSCRIRLYSDDTTSPKIIELNFSKLESVTVEKSHFIADKESGAASQTS